MHSTRQPQLAPCFVRSSRLRCLALIAGVLACGPRQPGSDEGNASETTGTTETTETTGDTGALLVPDPDLPSDGQCDIFEQDCPDGQKCAHYYVDGVLQDGHTCIEVLGDQSHGASCTFDIETSTDDCDASSRCWNLQEVDGELVGTCLAMCQNNADNPICPAMSDCYISSLATIALCFEICDPLAPGCPAGQSCQWQFSSFTCVAGGDISVGEVCSGGGCSTGTSCFDSRFIPSCAGFSCCTQYCDLNLGDGPCDAVLPGTGCVPFFLDDESPPGFEHVGLCLALP